MKKNVISIAEKASKAKDEIEKVVNDNTFTSGNLKLELSYNHWYKSNGGAPFEYRLSKGTHSAGSFTFTELNDLKNFLNSVTLIKS